MQARINTPFRKALIGLLLTALLVMMVMPIAPVLAQRETTPARGTLTDGLLGSGGALNLTTGFRGALDLRGWDVSLDAQHGPLFRPAGSDPSAPAFSGGGWSALGTGTNSKVIAIAVSGDSVYAGGWFTSAGTCTSGCNYIAKWNGSTWSALGTGMNSDVNAITVSSSGDVYAGGFFTSAGTCTSGCNYIAKWNGSTWSALGTGANNGVDAIAVSGSGDVYAGGYFSSAGTCTSGCQGIAKWDGSNWSALGTGMGGWYPNVFTIAVSGNTVYAGGQFASAGTCVSGCQDIAKWDGSNWSTLGSGTGGGVRAIAVSGSSIIAAGWFTSAGTCTWQDGCMYIAKWDGGSWSALGTGTSDYINTIAVSGSDLYAAGVFTSAGTCMSGCNLIAKWNGSTWSALGSGINANYQSVDAVAVSSSSVYAGGGIFTSAGTCTSDDGCNYIAKYGIPSTYRVYLPMVVR